MKESVVSIAEGKKEFSRLVKDTLQKKENFIVTNRGKRVAAIISYDEYRTSRRLEGYQKIMEARKAFVKAGVKAKDVFAETKRQLERKS